MKHTALAVVAGLFLCSASALAEDVPVTINGTAYVVRIDNSAYWKLTRDPDTLQIPRDATGNVSARTRDGTTWTVAADGSIYKDAMPFTTAKVSILALVGNTIFAKGAVSGKWSRWDQTYNSGAGAWLLAPNALLAMLEPATTTAGPAPAVVSPAIPPATPVSPPTQTHAAFPQSLMRMFSSK